MSIRISSRLTAVKTGIAVSMPMGRICGVANPQRAPAAVTAWNEDASPRAPTPTARVATT